MKEILLAMYPKVHTGTRVVWVILLLSFLALGFVTSLSFESLLFGALFYIIPCEVVNATLRK